MGLDQMKEAAGALESEGRTVEEAVAKALVDMGAARDEVHVEVLDEGARGLLSIFGGRPARVRVRRADGPGSRACRVTARILELMGVPAPVEERPDGDRIEIVVGETGSDGLLIGHQGETLFALQHIVNRIVSRQTRTREQIAIDIGGYRGRREAQIRKSAHALAERARETGREVMTEPLTAAERRVVHRALADEPGLATQAVGEGLLKRIAITPERGALGGGR